MKLIFLAMIFFPVSLSANPYTLEIRDPQEAIDALALEGAADICKRSETMTLEQKFEMTELARFYENRRIQMDINYNGSLARQAAREKFGISGNPSYEICARAFHK